MCPGKMYHRIEKWIEKLGINGFGPSLLGDLFAKGFVNTPIDFYRINLKKYLEKTNLVKATEKAFDNLYEVKELPLETIIAGYDIDGIGEKIIKLIIDKGHNTLDKIEVLTESDLVTIEGIGEDRAKKIIEGIGFIKNELVELTDKFIKIRENKGGDLEGLSFCFTGKMDLPRKELENMVLENGGTIKSAVTKDLSYLVNNDILSVSSKNKKALSLGVKIISEKTFMEII
jgi:DNA ligase (NAD+)